jgi:hypothetical protein
LGQIEFLDETLDPRKGHFDQIGSRVGKRKRGEVMWRRKVVDILNKELCIAQPNHACAGFISKSGAS